eukprot:scaffold161838_cov15-Tisochrysis_lutea.AAC.1
MPALANTNRSPDHTRSLSNASTCKEIDTYRNIQRNVDGNLPCAACRHLCWDPMSFPLIEVRRISSTCQANQAKAK